VIPWDELKPCGCGPTGKSGNQYWFCEKHITHEAVDEFMDGRFWAILICDVCFREAPEMRQLNQVVPLETLEQQFHQEMIQVAKFANQFNIGIRFLQMVEKKGGLPTAKKLLADAGPQQGLIRLKKIGHLDKCMEVVVLQERYRSLFTEAEIAEARRRLEMLGYFNVKKD
jgi:hypothetical protein